MTEFSVNFEPSIEGGDLLNQPLLIDLLGPRCDYRAMPAVDVWYFLDGMQFGYHPSNAFIVLSDLNAEWELATARRSHILELSGYPVLEVEFQEQKATFYHLDRPGCPRSQVTGSLDAGLVESEFARATSTLWSLVSRFCDSDLS